MTLHLPKKKQGNRKKKGYSVSFLKKRSRAVKLLISKRKEVLRDSSLSAFSRKQARKNLSISLWFDQERYKSFLVKLRKFALIVFSVDIGDSISWIVRSYEEIALTSGPVYAVKKFKSLHDIYLRIITSNDFVVEPYTSVNSRGYPKLLGPLLELAEGTCNERRAGLHAIQIIKLVGVWDDSFSLDTITKDPPVPMIPLNEAPKLGSYLTRVSHSILGGTGSVSHDKLIQCYKDTLRETFPDLERGKRISAIQKHSDVHFSGRNGPNGPCLTTVVLDHSYLEMNQDKLNYLMSIATKTRNSTLLYYLLAFGDEPYLWSNSSKLKPIGSRLSIKDEPWAKRRVFAICDWFSQSSLKGLHAYLFEWLAEQREDGTFDQDKVSEAVRIWTTETGKPESADLSAATDSIPVEVQCEILSQIADNELAVLWRCICCDRDFKVPNTGETVRYRTGQPMGILSSFAMLAVWHHIMLRTCLRYLGVSKEDTKQRYCVLGDDVSMLGTDLFKIYYELVCVLQGIGISKAKGFHAETQNNRNALPSNFSNSPTTAEFAKRIFYCGQEMTVVPPDELLNSFESPQQFPELLDSIVKRGYPELSDSDLPSLTSLCFHKKQALLLATNPLRRCPRRVTPAHCESDIYSRLPWYKPGFDEDSFKRIFFATLKERLIGILGSVLGNINKWIMFSYTNPEIRVKAWVYESETQSLLIRNTATRLAGIVADCVDEAEKVFKGDPTNWKGASEFLQSLQVIFEIDYLFKEKKISKKPFSHRYYSNKLFDAVLREAIKVMNQQ